jgi:hypothetical protein
LSPFFIVSVGHVTLFLFYELETKDDKFFVPTQLATLEKKKKLVANPVKFF